MKILNRFGQAVQRSSQFLQKYVEDYIAVNPQAKQFILKPKAVLLLCQQATARVEQLTSLEPDPQEGLVAVIEQNQVKVKVHFTPEKMVLKGDVIEGQLRLLNTPQIETKSSIYNALISGWRTFLGGYIPNQALPEGVRVNGNQVYYQLPKEQLGVIATLFRNLEDESSLSLSLKQGELQIESTVAINWNDLDLQSLLQIFNSALSNQQNG